MTTDTRQDVSETPAYLPDRAGPRNKFPEAAEGELAQLMIQYQQADSEALSQLVTRLSPMLLRFFLGPTATRPYAEDLLQEFWLRIHKARHTYRPGKPLLPWLLTIARYTRVDMYRRLRRCEASSLSQHYELSDVRSDPAMLRARIDFRKLIARLPGDQRQVVLQLKVLGMTLEEVANSTGTTVGAVKQRAHRAYRNLRSMIQGASRREVPPTKHHAASTDFAVSTAV